MDAIQQFQKSKKEDSEYITLADGESILIRKLLESKIIVKTGFDGKEKEVLRLICEVENSKGVMNKYFDNGTARFANELVEKNIRPGASFKLTREGLSSKTRYKISDVVPNVATLATATTPATT